MERLEQRIWRGEHGGTEYEVLKRCYTAGPFPMWNVWVKNRRLARGLANELRPYLQDGAELNFVCHSNGADIVTKAMRLLAAEGFATRTAIFVAAAIRADVDKSGIRPLILSGHLRHAFAYCSSGDRALRWRVTWPYGHLGRVGFRLDGAAYRRYHGDARRPGLSTERHGDEVQWDWDGGSVVVTRWWDGYGPGWDTPILDFGHSDYWHPLHEPFVHAQIFSDLDTGRAGK